MTEHKKTERDLFTGEELYRTLVEYSLDGIYISALWGGGGGG